MKAIGYAKETETLPDTPIDQQIDEIEQYAEDHDVELVDIITDELEEYTDPLDRDGYTKIVVCAYTSDIDAVLAKDRKSIQWGKSVDVLSYRLRTQIIRVAPEGMEEREVEFETYECPSYEWRMQPLLEGFNRTEEREVLRDHQ